MKYQGWHGWTYVNKRFYTFIYDNKKDAWNALKKKLIAAYPKLRGKELTEKGEIDNFSWGIDEWQ